MNRGKYRAWDEDNEVMYYSDAGWNETHPESEDCIFDFHKGHVVAFLRQTEPGTIDEPPYDYGEPVDVEQYTGLKDKNGVEIYEDDLVQFKGHVGNFYEDGRQETLLGRVFYKTSGSIDYCLKVGDQNYGLNSNDVDEYEIIGNMHQNPELSEDKE